MTVLLHPSYFPSVLHWAIVAQAEDVQIEIHDNYQKQSFRNRTLIAGPNGLQTLSVPVNFTQNNRRKTSEVEIDNSQRWQDNHKKSLLAGYSNSPFFEFYFDQIEPVFSDSFESIMDLDFATMEVLSKCLGMDKSLILTKSFEKEPQNTFDFRYLTDPRRQPELEFTSYIQVFSEKHGFLPNLSCLDLLFNEGPNSLNYLESIEIGSLLF